MHPATPPSGAVAGLLYRKPGIQKGWSAPHCLKDSGMKVNGILLIISPKWIQKPVL